MTRWTDEDAWIFLAATTRGRVEIGTLDRTADHLMHSRPNPGAVSATMSRLVGAGLFRYDGRCVRARPDAFAIARRAESATDVSPWEPGGSIARALAELEVRGVPLLAGPPAGFASWYDVLAERRASRWRRLARSRTRRGRAEPTP